MWSVKNEEALSVSVCVYDRNGFLVKFGGLDRSE